MTDIKYCMQTLKRRNETKLLYSPDGTIRAPLNSNSTRAVGLLDGTPRHGMTATLPIITVNSSAAAERDAAGVLNWPKSKNKYRFHNKLQVFEGSLMD